MLVPGLVWATIWATRGQATNTQKNRNLEWRAMFTMLSVLGLTA
jgi:hypothetical protein